MVYRLFFLKIVPTNEDPAVMRRYLFELLNTFDKDGRSVLMFACAGGMTKLVEILLGATTAAARASGGFRGDAIPPLPENHLLSVCSALFVAESVNAKDRFGQTALHYAISKNHHDLGDMLFACKSFKTYEDEKSIKFFAERNWEEFVDLVPRLAPKMQRKQAQKARGLDENGRVAAESVLPLGVAKEYHKDIRPGTSAADAVASRLGTQLKPGTQRPGTSASPDFSRKNYIYQDLGLPIGKPQLEELDPQYQAYHRITEDEKYSRVRLPSDPDLDERFEDSPAPPVNKKPPAIVFIDGRPRQMPPPPPPISKTRVGLTLLEDQEEDDGIIAKNNR